MKKYRTQITMLSRRATWMTDATADDEPQALELNATILIRRIDYEFEDENLESALGRIIRLLLASSTNELRAISKKLYKNKRKPGKGAVDK